MHHPIWEDRFETDKRGNIILVTNARGMGLNESNRLKIHCEFDCLKTYEDGRQFCRNLYFSNMGGYMVDFPQEYLYNYGHQQKQKRGYDYYYRTRQNVNLPSFGFTERDRAIILSKYPDFMYVLDKWKGFHTKRDVLNILRIWLEHPEIELPLSLGYEKVCFTKSFFKMKKTQLKQLYKFMKEHKGADYSLTDLKFLINHKPDDLKLIKDMERIMGKKIGYEYALWVSQHLEDFSKYQFADIYKRYLEKCKYIGKDINDPYWKFPKDFKRQKELVEGQYNNIQRLKEKEKCEVQIKNYLERVGKFIGRFDKEMGGYSIVVPSTLEQWTTQAEKLHQCIIRMNYLDKCNDNYILVFIYKDGEPVATCEVTDVLKKKIGQFYADEEDRNNCLPTDEVRTVMNNWLDELQAA